MVPHWFASRPSARPQHTPKRHGRDPAWNETPGRLQSNLERAIPFRYSVSWRQELCSWCHRTEYPGLRTDDSGSRADRSRLDPTWRASLARSTREQWSRGGEMAPYSTSVQILNNGGGEHGVLIYPNSSTEQWKWWKRYPILRQFKYWTMEGVKMVSSSTSVQVLNNGGVKWHPTLPPLK